MKTSDESALFEDFFLKLQGNRPFRWQKRLAQWFADGKIENSPIQCEVQTGLGKTAIIPIWYWAFQQNPLTTPRRLVYVVNRRTVVDQATREAESLAENFRKEFGPQANELTVSTLRGQFADNHVWHENPVRPAIIVGTVDMIGSRLLFSGYGGSGKYTRSLHAGLLGQDSLIVVDEAHLCPAFIETLVAIQEKVQQHFSVRPFRVMLLSATPNPPRRELRIQPKVFSMIPEEDMQDTEVAKRLCASKQLCLSFPESDESKTDEAIAAKMAQKALRHGNTAIAIFVNTVKRANLIREQLVSTQSPHPIPSEDISILTGEMRGYERDQWVKAHIPVLFQSRHSKRGVLVHPIFLIATAAGEVGINFDADHAVCDLTTLERMVQRLGRVNRFGDSTAEIDLVLDKNADSAASIGVLSALKNLPTLGEGYSVSPAHLSEMLRSLSLEQISAASTLPSLCPPLDSARMDDWSMTTLSHRDYPRPQVDFWLRGLTPDDDTSHVSLVWRKDLDYAQSGQDAANMASQASLRAVEIAQVHHARANELLGKLRKREPRRFCAILDTSNEWKGKELGEMPEDNKERDDLIRNTTILLPTSVGGLGRDGIWDPQFTDEVSDVLEAAQDGGSGNDFTRLLLEPADEVLKARWLVNGEDIGMFESESEAMEAIEKKGFKFLFSSGDNDKDSDDPSKLRQDKRAKVWYLAQKNSSPEDNSSDWWASRSDITLDKHNDDIDTEICRMLSELGLDSEIAEAIAAACRLHDLGKKRTQWQKAIGNFNPNISLAKSGSTKPFQNKYTQGYRHEFGSMRDALALLSIKRKDLALHLIAAHHGRARPGFEPEAYQILPLQRECRQLAQEIEISFARLQMEFGWWQLAYLESLVKCADALASRVS
jgi:CRISPR-associated endonuclease/helicase Cas3